MSYLSIKNLTKSFGRTQALSGLSFEVPEHSVCALVGANGAGKTTTFALIGNFLKADSGSITLAGEDLSEYRRNGGAIGLLPQDMQFYESRTVQRQLMLFAELTGYSGNEAREEVRRVLRLVALEDRAASKVHELSRGMMVRLAVAQAFVGQPPLVLLDEPMAGLDPKMRRLFRESIDAIRGECTIIISSHELMELQSICDYVCIIDKGRVRSQGEMRELLNLSSKLIFKVSGLPEDFETFKKELLVADFAIERINDRSFAVIFDSKELSLPDLNRAIIEKLFEKSIGIEQVIRHESLEDSFLASTGEGS